MIPKVLNDNKYFLHFLLYEASEEEKKAILSVISPARLEALREITFNAFKKKNIPLEKSTVEKLKPHQCSMEELALGKPCTKRKRQIFVQQGGFLPIVLSAVLPLIAGELFKLL